MRDLTIQVNKNVRMHVGTIEETAQVLTIQSSAIPMIDQLITYLDPLPLHDTGFPIQKMSLGCAALCIRWGSYLATLIDSFAPLHPDLLRQHHDTPPSVSLITNSEMRRMNIEISANLAALVRFYRERGWDALRTLLAKAYAYLPMSHHAVQKSAESVESLIGALALGTELLLAKTVTSPDALLPYQVPVQDADRCLANILMAQAWRNSLIEDIHTGTPPTVPVTPHQQRMLPATRQLLLQEVTTHMDTILSLFPLLFDPQEHLRELPTWPMTATVLANTRYASPAVGWSLTDQSAPVSLVQEKP